MLSVSNGARALGAFSILATTVLLDIRDAAACGGCFHPQVEQGSSVITDHRMVFSVSLRETILWDQVQYSGDPKEFAWVLPVRDGATIELSRDAWIGSLDTSTRTTVQGPERSCGGGGFGGGSSGGGCGTSTTTSAASYGSGATYDASAPSDGGFVGSNGVDVLSQSVIGPYQAVTIRASGGTGINEWLTKNGFAIPENVFPVVDAYTRERFDFIALRLRPGTGVRAMQPVRVRTPGADTSMPLRMVTAGVGASVGLTLWVVAEGRYHTKNFPDAVVDWNKLAWDGAQARSNLTTLTADALSANDGRGWLTEAALRINNGASTANVYDTYNNLCRTLPMHQVPCDESALPPEDGSPDGEPLDPDGGADAGDPDAGDGSADADAGDGGVDAGSKPTACTKWVSGCDGWDDYDVATENMHSGDIWVTRLRAKLPVGALDRDLVLEAAPAQVEDSPARNTDKFTDDKFDPCAGVRSNAISSDAGGFCMCRSSRVRDALNSWFAVAIAAVGSVLVARRHARNKHKRR